jgi:pimeloyl-ACP methyl ester carboxylesterase
MQNNIQKELIEQGTYSICQNDKVIGAETYEVYRTGNGYRFVGKIRMHIQAGDMEQEAELFTDHEYLPLELRVKSSLADKLSATTIRFFDGQAQVSSDTSGSLQSKEIMVSPGTLILSSNIFHHFAAILKRYLHEKGGKQQFPLFPGRTIYIEMKKKYWIELGTQNAEVTHYLVNVENVLGLNLYCIENRLVKISIPLQRINAILQDMRGLECGTDLEEPQLDDLSSRENADFLTEEVKFSSKGDIVLGGTLTIPAKAKVNFPAIVLISGSGAQDRNGDTIGSGGIHYGIFRTIAERLTANGLCVLRYDDRGAGSSSGKFESAGLFDFAEDANAAVVFLQSHPRVDDQRLGLVGLSEGGLIAAMIAANSSNIRAVALMGTLAESLDKVLVRQYERFLPSALPEDQRDNMIEKRRRTFETIKATQDWDSEDVEDAVRKAIPVERRLWFQQHFATDPMAVLKRVDASVAILHGSQDVQVEPEAALALEQALKDSGHTGYIVKIFDGLDHLFMPSQGRGLSEYADSDRKLDVTFLEFLSNWLVENLM